MKLSFVILHYQNEAVTKKCLELLVRLRVSTNESFDIVVVDNASPNGSGEKLKKEFPLEYITVLLAKKNYGFAQGNNLGYKYAKDQLNAEIIIVMNNDVLIEDLHFIETLNKVQQQQKVDIIAPNIITTKGYHQNPARTSQMTKEEIFFRKLQLRCLLLLTYCPYSYKLYYKIRRKQDPLKGLKKQKIVEKNYDIVPHGACIIVLKSFIEQENELFNPDTFLFIEEELFYEKIKRKKYNILYISELQVLHLEDQSINLIDRNERKRKRFMAKEKIKSLKILARTIK